MDILVIFFFCLEEVGDMNLNEFGIVFDRDGFIYGFHVELFRWHPISSCVENQRFMVVP